MPSRPLVSILMLVHNAPQYVEVAIRSVKANTPTRHELIVLDNGSDPATVELLQQLDGAGLIDKLRLLNRNSLFAEGNNVAASMAAPEATHYLLLNSDVEIRDRGWLDHLLAVHKRGITSYGVALDPLRVDGYCLLIDADLYRAHPLDQSHQWWWGVTKQQAALLREGHSVQGYGEHERYVHHFGGKSGSAFQNAKGMDVSRAEVRSWFNGSIAHVLDRRANGAIPNHEPPSLVRRIGRKVKALFVGA